MKKLLKGCAVLVLLALVFTGCPEPGPGKGKDPINPPVTQPVVLEMTLYWSLNGKVYKDKPAGFNPGDEVIFWAEVKAEQGASAIYTLTITAADNAILFETVNTREGGKQLTFKNASGTFTVKAESTGVDATGAKKVIEWTNIEVGNGTYDPPDEVTDPAITPPEVPTEINFDDAAWRLLNTATARGVTLDNKTTKTLTATNGRYVVYNNEPGALIDNDASLVVSGSSANRHFKDVTVMYLNKAFESDLENWEPFGIEARIRISKWRDSAPIYGSQTGQGWASVRQGVIVGMIEDPDKIDVTFDGTGSDALATNPQNAPAFVGQRMAAGGQHRGYLRRTNGEYGSQSISPTTNETNMNVPGVTPSVTYSGQLGMNDYVDGSSETLTTKQECFADQEYVYKVMRTGSTTYKFYIYNSTGDTLLCEYGFSGNNNVPVTSLTSYAPVYLAFLIYGVEAEISNIKIYYKGATNVAWEDPAVKNTAPLPIEPKRVEIRAEAPLNLKGNTANYSCLSDEFPATGAILKALVVPASGPQIVEWGVETGSDVVEVEYGTVGLKKPGKATVKAEVGGKKGLFTFDIIDIANVVRPTAISVKNTPFADLVIGNNTNNQDRVKLEVEYTPAGAMAGVTWSAEPADAVDFITIGDDDYACIKKSYDADTTITLKAKSDWAPTVEGTATVKAKKDDGTRKWTFGTGTLAPWVDRSDGNVNTTSLTLSGGLTLTPTGNGARWYSGQAGLANLDTDPTHTTTTQKALYWGYYNPASSASTTGWGKIASFGAGKKVKVSIVASNTGDSFADRYLWIKFAGEAERVLNTWQAGPSNGNAGVAGTTGRPEGAPLGVDYYTFSRIGEGEITWGSDNAFRVWAVMVEPAVALTALSVSPTTASVVKGKKVAGPTVTKTPAEANDAIEWVSTDTTYVTVNASTGEITGVKGTVTPVNVTVRKVGDPTIFANVAVTVQEIHLTALAVTPDTVEVNQTATLPANTFIVTKTPEDATDEIEWVSADTAIATVNAATGAITGVAEGETTVSVQKVGNSSIKADVTVTVLPFVPLTSLSVTPTAVSIYAGEVVAANTFTVTKTPTDTTDNIEWVSADPTVATVNAATGEITGVKVGTTTVSVRRVGDSTMKADVAVTVKADDAKLIWRWKIGDPIPTSTKNTTTNITHSGKTFTLFTANADTASLSIASGHATAPNGAMLLNNVRLAIGLPETPEYNNSLTTITATNGAYATNAELDLDRKFTLTVKWGRLTGTAFSAVLNNWAASNDGGVLKGNGTAGVVPNTNGQIFNLSGTTNTPTIATYTIDPDNLVVSTVGAGLTPPVTKDAVIHNQFIQFRLDSSASLWIESIILKYED